MESEVGEGLKATVLWYDESKIDVMPIDMDFREESRINTSLERWLLRRVIPKNRAYVHEVLKTMGLSAGNTKGIIEVCKGLSLNDSFWVVREDFEGMFADYNLFENNFTEVLALAAFTGEGSLNGASQAQTTSPEPTTNGMLPKAWRNIDEKIVLYKGASAIHKTEPYNEYYASQLADAMGLSPVIYGLDEWKGKLASTCMLFTDKDTSFVSAYELTHFSKYRSISSFYKEHDEESGTNLNDYFLSILAFDALIANTDRHFGNFGVLRDNKTGKIINSAPVFDNGQSLFYDGFDYDIKHHKEYLMTHVTATRDSFDDIARVFCGNLQREQLKKLMGFVFIPHEKYNMQPKRLQAIQNYIQTRAQELLNIIGN